MQIYRVTRKAVSEHKQTAEFENFYSTKAKANKAIDKYIEQEEPYYESLKDGEYGSIPTRIVKMWFPDTDYHIEIFRELIEVE